MGRGKIELRKIDNPTNLQVTFSKRRAGITKKAQELSVLCDAQILLILKSGTGKFYDFITSTTTAKKIIDQYQKEKAPDLWQPQFEKMQEELERLRERNFMLKREIRHRTGRDLHDVGYDELINLEDTMKSAVDVIHQAKLKDLKKKTNTMNKKVKSLEDQKQVLDHIVAKYEYHMLGGEYLAQQYYAQVNPDSEYGVTHLYTFPLHQGHAIRIP